MRIIEYCKHIPSRQLLFLLNQPSAVVSYSLRVLSLFGLAVVVPLNLVACSQISLSGKTNHNLIRTAPSREEKSSSSWTKPINLNGLWKIGFRYQGKTGLGSMRIRQNNQTFVGSGKDEGSNATFTIDRGSINRNEIIFLKRYDSRPNQALQCHGKFSYLSTEAGESPYMGGDFSAEGNGGVIVGDWEAAMDVVKPVPVANNERQPVSEPPASNAPVNFQHSPDLSGKWNVAYEYNFKTVHSTMFLEQDRNKLTGHGVDLNSKEKFVINKGWYSFPHVTIVRQYPNGRDMVFKADLTQVSDKEYTGPYLSGKTQGGGDWEAERVN